MIEKILTFFVSQRYKNRKGVCASLVVGPTDEKIEQGILEDYALDHNF